MACAAVPISVAAIPPTTVSRPRGHAVPPASSSATTNVALPVKSAKMAARCPPTGTVCNGVCCGPSDQNRKWGCVKAQCCPHENACGDVCCDVLSLCANKGESLCCSFGSTVCAGSCCDPGGECINGQCCPPDQRCGGVCCPNGQTCLNPKTHQCAPRPSGQVPCLPEGGTALCCAPNVDCCIGTCCKPGE